MTAAPFQTGMVLHITKFKKFNQYFYEIKHAHVGFGGSRYTVQKRTKGGRAKTLPPHYTGCGYKALMATVAAAIVTPTAVVTAGVFLPMVVVVITF